MSIGGASPTGPPLAPALIQCFTDYILYQHVPVVRYSINCVSFQSLSIVSTFGEPSIHGMCYVYMCSNFF